MIPPFPPNGVKATGAPSPSDRLLIQALAKLHRTALGIAVGALAGFVIFAATVFLLVKGGRHVGPTLGLLSQYFIGYTVTWKGNLVGLLYGLVFGFIAGWLIAFLRNFFVSVYLHAVKLKANLSSASDFMDHP